MQRQILLPEQRHPFTLFKDGKLKGQSRINQKDTLLEAVCEKRWGFEAKWMAGKCLEVKFQRESSMRVREEIK